MKNTTFPVAVYNHEENVYWYLYSVDELIDFLNEHDEFFTYSSIEQKKETV